MGITAAYMVPHPPLIVPEIGRGEEAGIQDTIHAYEEIGRRIAADRPETIVLVSPHQTMYADYFHISPGAEAAGDFGRFRAPQVRITVSYDTEFVNALCAQARTADFPAGTAGEREPRLDHGTMVPLYFVNRHWESYRLVRIGLSGLPLRQHYELGRYIRKTAEALGRKTVVIASGDLSHRLKEDGPYGYREEGPAYDARLMEAMGSGAFGKLFAFSEDFCDRAGECGHRSFVMMAGALDGMDVKAERLSYEEEERMRLARRRTAEDDWVRLARRTITEYVRNGRVIEVPEGLPAELYHQRAGVFVSIKEDGRLRGCIGTIQAVQASVAEEIIQNAVSASTRDPRFPPITADELERLVISVDVLGETERAASMADLDVKRYGVIVTKGGQNGGCCSPIWRVWIRWRSRFP